MCSFRHQTDSHSLTVTYNTLTNSLRSHLSFAHHGEAIRGGMQLADSDVDGALRFAELHALGLGALQRADRHQPDVSASTRDHHWEKHAYIETRDDTVA